MTVECLPDQLPKITVGVTCHCADATIARCIESAARQDWANLEIIVVDDCSDDRSIDIIERMARSDSRIRLIRHDINKGYPGALNTIVAHATGEFIAFFDDDDESDTARLRRQWQRLTDYEQQHGTELVLCYSNRDVVTPDGTVEYSKVCAIGRNAPEPNGPGVADFLLWHHETPGFVWGSFGSCTLFSRRATLMAIGPFDEAFRRCAEWDFAIRLAFSGGHFIAVDKALVTQHLTVSDDKAGKKPLVYALALRRKHRTYLARRHLYLASLAMAHSRFHYATGGRWRSRCFVVLACLANPMVLVPSALANSTSKRRLKRHTA